MVNNREDNLLTPSVEYELCETTKGYWELRWYGELNGARTYKDKTQAEMAVDELKAKGNCVDCGAYLDDRYMEPTKSNIRNLKLCFSCLFWVELHQLKDRSNCLVIDGCHYMFYPEGGLAAFRGFGGKKFRIRVISSGEEFETTNLWTQGVIPNRYLDNFPNNAEFVR